MRRIIFLVSLIWIASMIVGPGSARASLMLPMSVEELTAEAELVVKGTVLEVETRRSSGGGRLFTVVTFAVEESWKGPAPESVRIHVPGGSIDGITQLVIGMPRFEVGETAVVFLRRVGAAQSFADPAEELNVARQVVGMAQGKLQVELAPEGGLQAAPKLEGLELIRPEDPAAAPAPAPIVDPIPLPKLKARVRAVGR